ncbi:dCTP pyrophosphatase 1 [Acipenser oxyrinchus oxyrinchus]|uniref:dCTP pyrophosphatase 1 n=1 Tax=Acipenser oxyrinchus oxyrinchus TaxID=40147 RepID=A0AAD8CIA3_ACIOX|nr:dCTP pyrophosphatase 1 [Acipenser oxyrinchus oxyrinchus]
MLESWREIHAWGRESCFRREKTGDIFSDPTETRLKQTQTLGYSSFCLFFSLMMAERVENQADPKTPTENGTSTPERISFSAKPNLEDIRQLQAQFTDERDWNQYHQPRNLLLALVGEVGEVAELFQWKGEVEEGLPDWSEQERMALSHELSDVLIYLVELAEKCHVDLPRAVLEKMELNRIKYPASKVRGSAKKYTEYQD